MSMRRSYDATDDHAHRLRFELEQLKYQNATVDASVAAAHTATVSSPPGNDTLTFDQLTATEQAAGSLGVHPEAWKPSESSPPPELAT